MKKIYCFGNGKCGNDIVAVAIAEDGTVLGGHICSNESFIPYDLGVVEGYRPDRHKTYAEHYPDGYEMEFVKMKDIKTHVGLQKAFDLNAEMDRAEEAKKSQGHDTTII